MIVEPLIERARTWLWSEEAETGPRPRRLGVRAARVGWAVIHDIAEGQITLRAMSLVFTTLLALVPLLAVSFSVLKGFGVHNQIEPLLLRLLEPPLGEKGREITERIIDFVQNVRVDVLGAVGLALLFYTAISLVQKIESAFNHIWQVRRTRPLVRRFSDYVSVLIIGPILLFTSFGLSAALLNTDLIQSLLALEPFGRLYNFLVALLPYLLIIAAFTFLYVFIPNTRVRLSAAFAGGLISGIAWQTTAWGFASFVASSTRYTAIYSGFAILIFFMIWVYLNWLILLLGSCIVFYVQHPESTAVHRRGRGISLRARERLALQVLHAIGRRLYSGAPAASRDELMGELNVPGGVVDELLSLLEAGGLIVESGDEAPVYVAAVPFDAVTVREAWQTIRTRGETTVARDPLFERVDEILVSAESAAGERLDGMTLKELAGQAPP